MTTVLLKTDEGLQEAKSEDYPLYNADPICQHIIVDRFYQGGGYGCSKCKGWFCL